VYIEDLSASEESHGWRKSTESNCTLNVYSLLRQQREL
jgi:hypothetical protein